MGTKFNESAFSKITYNGTDLTVLKYNNTPVWGKPYSLSINAGENSTITVTRTSSPNENASTGVLTNGSTIYHGDVLTISYAVSDGYTISTSTVNNITFTNGTSFTVAGNMNVATTAIVSKGWHTVWEGTKTITTYNGATTFSGVLATAEKTSITGTVTLNVYWENSNNYTTGDFNVEVPLNNAELNCGIGFSIPGEYMLYTNQSSTYSPSDYPLYIAFQSASTNKLNCKSTNYFCGYNNNDTTMYYITEITKIIITSIKQYY